MTKQTIDDEELGLRPPRRGWLGLLLCLFTLSGCVTGVVDENGNEQQGGAQCADPLRGSRYSVCARLSASGFESSGAGGKRVIATVDSAHDKTSSRYTLQGGFHAYR